MTSTHFHPLHIPLSTPTTCCFQGHLVNLHTPEPKSHAVPNSYEASVTAERTWTPPPQPSRVSKLNQTCSFIFPKWPAVCPAVTEGRALCWQLTITNLTLAHAHVQGWPSVTVETVTVKPQSVRARADSTKLSLKSPHTRLKTNQQTAEPFCRSERRCELRQLNLSVFFFSFFFFFYLSYFSVEVCWPALRRASAVGPLCPPARRTGGRWTQGLPPAPPGCSPSAGTNPRAVGAPSTGWSCTRPPSPRKSPLAPAGAAASCRRACTHLSEISCVYKKAWFLSPASSDSKNIKLLRQSSYIPVDLLPPGGAQPHATDPPGGKSALLAERLGASCASCALIVFDCKRIFFSIFFSGEERVGCCEDCSQDRKSVTDEISC